MTEEERRIMERHTVEGEVFLHRSGVLLAGRRLFQLAAEIAAHHHERWDGQGCPMGLAARETPLAARIASVADVFDALTSARPYKPNPPDQPMSTCWSRPGNCDIT